MEITARALVKDYGAIRAVDGISFRINSGEIFALLGQNGAGKSSIIRMLVGMTQPDSGAIEITLDGVKHQGIPRSLIGYLPEDRGLYADKSVVQNLKYIAQLHGLNPAQAQAEIDTQLDLFGLTERKREELKRLSKGNQQKVQLIAAVLHRPRLVVLDEPFSGLDPVNQELVLEFLKRLRAQGATIILSAHQMALVERIADQILLINKGQSIYSGSLVQIRAEAMGTRSLVARLHDTAIFDPSLLPDQLFADFEQLASREFRLLLREQASLSACLHWLSGQFELAGVELVEADLHQIYLSMMEEAQAEEVPA